MRFDFFADAKATLAIETPISGMKACGTGPYGRDANGDYLINTIYYISVQDDSKTAHITRADFDAATGDVPVEVWLRITYDDDHSEGPARIQMRRFLHPEPAAQTPAGAAEGAPV